MSKVSMTDINGDLFERRPSWRLFLLCLVACLCVSAKAQRAGSHLDVPVEFARPYEGSRDSLLRIVGQKAGIVIAFSSRVLMPGTVSMPAGKATVRECLDVAFGRFSVRYVCQDAKVVVAADSVRMVSVSGFCRDAVTGEPMVGAHVSDTLLGRAVACNEHGFFSLRVPTGRVPLRATFVGYSPEDRGVVLMSDTLVSIRLRPQLLLEQVDVLADDDAASEAARENYTDLPMEQVKAFPALLGEYDLIRAIQQTPGVNSGSEGIGGMSVRGGSQDQNMVYLDDAPLYSPNHMLGLFSAFNSEVVKSGRLIKSGFPARYGGRMSSVFDIRTLDGIFDEFQGSANVGLVASSLLAKFPIKSGSSAALFSARRSYCDLYGNAMQTGNAERYAYMFYDIHGKVNWRLSERDNLYLSIFYCKDRLTSDSNLDDIEIEYADKEVRKLTLSDKGNNQWGSLLASARWNRVFANRAFLNAVVWYSLYNFRSAQTQQADFGSALSNYNNRTSSNLYSNGVADYGLRADVYALPSWAEGASVRAGLLIERRRFSPLVNVNNSTDTLETSGVSRDLDIFRNEAHTYVEGLKRFSSVSASVGLHLSVYGRNGRAPSFVFEPRANISWRPVDELTLKAGYSLTSQSLYQLRLVSVPTPSDLWMPVPSSMGAQRASQISLSLRWRISPGLTLSVEGYDKRLIRQVTYRALSVYEILSTRRWDELCAQGSGYARGVELFLHRRRGRLSGWVGYAFSKTSNSFADINDGEPFPSDHDRLHSVQLFSMFKVNEMVDVSLNWSYGSGSPLTLPSQRYYVPGFEEAFSVPAQRNAIRMPASHQLSVGANFRFGGEREGSVLSFGVYNLYGMRNPMFVYWKASDAGAYDLKQFSLIACPWPYVKYSIHF